MKSLLSVATFLLFFITAQAQEKLDEIIKPGTKLMYRIDLKTRSYDVKITVKDLKPFEFDYEIIDSANAKGTITHSAAGMANGIILYNSFSAGNKLLDDNTTSLRISQKVYKNLSGKKRRLIIMFLNGLWREQSKIGFADGDKNFMVRINGKQTTIQQEYARPKIKFNKAYQTTGEEFFTFYNSSKLPLILKMRTDFYIELLDIINNSCS